MTAVLPRRERPRDERSAADRGRDWQLIDSAGSGWLPYGGVGVACYGARYAAAVWWNRRIRSFEWDVYRWVDAAHLPLRMLLSGQTPNGLAETAAEALSAAEAALAELDEGGESR